VRQDLPRPERALPNLNTAPGWIVDGGAHVL
jgi:hypothetical protein